MKLIEEQKKANFNEEIHVKMTLKELVIIYATLADGNSRDIAKNLQEYSQFVSLAEEVKVDDLSFKVYNQVCEILKKKGIYV